MSNAILSFALFGVLLFISLCIGQVPSLPNIIRDFIREITPETLLIMIAVGIMMAAFKVIPPLMAKKRISILKVERTKRSS